MTLSRGATVRERFPAGQEACGANAVMATGSDQNHRNCTASNTAIPSTPLINFITVQL